MKTLEIHPQPRLGASRVLRFCLRGIRYRIFRSGITVAVIGVAVAFLMNILAENMIRGEILSFARERLNSLQLADTWAVRLGPLMDDLRAEVAARFPDMAEVPPVLLLERADAGFFATARERGFEIDEETSAAVIGLAGMQRRENDIEQVFQQAKVRTLFAAALNRLPGDLDSPMMWKALKNREVPAGLLRLLEQEGWGPAGMSAEDLRSLALLRAERERLSAIVLAHEVGGDDAGDSRIVWLIGLSLLVCGVGITNALLMTVTERYREIATLKCLGARDGTVMGLFVMEGALFGLVGGLLGALLGGLLGLLRLVSEFGTLTFAGVHVWELAFLFVVCAIMGVLLSAVASLLPSLKAAKMPPLEAMRVE